MDSQGYAWYRLVHGTDLGQSDILERCPVFLAPTEFAVGLCAPEGQRWSVIVVGCFPLCLPTSPLLSAIG